MHVVRLISPVYVLLFITEFCQFAAIVYASLVRFMLGAFVLRLFSHTYNLSVALSVFLTPTLLILHHPNLAAKFIKKKARTMHVSPMDASATTATYFGELKKMWR
ncbi:unnamed protein product [Cylicocyclus nassatus]|uniref:Uncharacterized protein n=1 Tax=Cylicocyclus nassatus TaxID=53992 RepID=A0AA36M6Z7_CYLNA|nr:unnamed protein product [Cylicocyclus nassatus]